MVDAFLGLADNTTGNELLVLGSCQVACLLPNGTKVGRERRKLILRELYTAHPPSAVTPTDPMDSDEQDEALADQ